MDEFGARREQPELKELVVEASQALARLDASRLEELALSCEALNRGLAAASPEDRARLAFESRGAVGEMAVLARVLDVTGGNLRVMNRLREVRAGRLEYSDPQARGWSGGVGGHGDN